MQRKNFQTLSNRFEELTGVNLTGLWDDNGLVWYKVENRLFETKPLYITLERQMVEEYGREAYNLLMKINDRIVKGELDE